MPRGVLHSERNLCRRRHGADRGMALLRRFENSACPVRSELRALTAQNQPLQKLRKAGCDSIRRAKTHKREEVEIELPVSGINDE
jgi:hypothetical protein